MTKTQTSEQLIRRIFNRIFLILTVFNLVAVVTYSIVQISQTESTGIMSGMTSQKENTFHSMPFKNLSNFEEQIDFIRIRKVNGNETMSEGTKAFLNRPSFVLGKLRVTGSGIFDYVHVEKSGVTYELWLSVNSILRSGALMLAFIVTIILATYGIGRRLIRRYSKRLSAPIRQLVAEIKTTKGKLEIPENPIEIQELAMNFNALIKRLNDKVKQEEQFVSDASHELRTPVAGIRGNISLLKRRWREHPEIIEEALNSLDAASERLAILIEDLLSLSRKTQNVRPEEIILSHFIAEILDSIATTLPQKIKIEGENEVSVRSDPLALGKILTVLLENASQYAPANSEIIVKFDDEEIQIIDQGSGIPDSEKGKIFDRFYRLDSSRGETQGNGLGLSIAQEYAKRNQTQLFVTDNPPQGSIFHLIFR